MTQPLQFRIRAARVEDQQAIRQAVKQAGLDRTSLDWRRFKLAESASGEMLGICQVRRYWDTRELGSLWVRGDCRGRGLGRALVDACLAEETPPVFLECLAARQSYYERLGFRRVPLRQAPRGLRLKAGVGGAAVRLFLRQRVIVMRWDGSPSPAELSDQGHEGDR